MLRGEAFREGVHFQFGSIHADIAMQASEHLEKACLPALHVTVETDRSPDLRHPGPEHRRSKIGGKHTDHGERIAAEQNGTAKDGRITLITALPETMAEDRDGRRAGMILLRKKAATEKRLHAENIEDARAGASARHTLG